MGQVNAATAGGRALPWWLMRVLLGAVAITAMTGMAVGGNQGANPLAADRWQHRPLVVVTPSRDNPAFQDLWRRMERHADGMAERDMVRYVVTAQTAHKEGQSLTTEQRAALLQAVDADPTREAELILVGKDGGVKMRAGLATELSAIFERIDRMPMRQREMRR